MFEEVASEIPRRVPGMGALASQWLHGGAEGGDSGQVIGRPEA